MRSLILLFFLWICASFTQQSQYFQGKIVYKYQMVDANKNDITDAMAQFLGREQHYYVNDKNYKSYNEKGNLIQLYNADSNIYRQILNNKEVHSINASDSTSSIFTAKKTDQTEVIAGYLCNTVEVITDEATTTYYYSPKIKINPKVYTSHNYGEWNKILNQTGGCLPLKFEMILHKQGFMIWTSTAISIEKTSLTDDNFTLK